MICSRVKKFLVPGVGPTIVILMSKFKDFSELQSLSSNGPILKVEQVRIVFCWLETSHTLPTSTMSMSRSVQCECPLQLSWSWCSISVVLIRVLPLEQPLSSQPAFFFSHPTILKNSEPSCTSSRMLTWRSRWNFMRIWSLLDKLVEQWWSIPEVVGSIPIQIRDFSTSLGGRSSWSC